MNNVISNNSLCVVIQLKKIFQVFLFNFHIIFNISVMIDPICYTVLHNSMVPHGNKKYMKSRLEVVKTKACKLKSK